MGWSGAELQSAKPPAQRYREAREQLRSAQKSNVGAAPYSRYINRPLGRRLASLAYLIHITPDAVTLVSAFCTFLGIAAVCVLPPAPLGGLAVCLALVLGYALDSADGQLARLRGGGSAPGEWLDHMVDCGKIATIHLAVLVGLARFGDLSQAWLLLPIGFSAVASVKFFGKILTEQLRRHAGSGPARGGTEDSLVRKMLIAPTDYGILILAFALWGWTGVFLPVYGVLFLANVLFLAAALVAWYRQMRALDSRTRLAK